jgi:hypothetical protein
MSAFRHRNYRLFFIGQGISLCGTWMQTIALGWLVLSLSHNSGVAIGAAIALQFVPTLFLGVWGGVLAELRQAAHPRAHRDHDGGHRGRTGGAPLTGIVSLWMVFVIVLFQGVAQSIDNPAPRARLRDDWTRRSGMRSG